MEQLTKTSKQFEEESKKDKAFVERASAMRQLRDKKISELNNNIKDPGRATRSETQGSAGRGEGF